MNKARLILNRVQCNICDDIITSRYTHDFQFCKCKKTFVDGGLEYMRVGGEDYTDFSVWSNEDFAVVRNFAEWGTYGKNGDEELKWIKVSEMSEDHIKAVISSQDHMNEAIRNVMFLELKYRDEHLSSADL